MSDKPRIVVLGDRIKDRLLTCRASGLNPEGPGIVFKVESTDDKPGGAAAVAMLCTALGVETDLVCDEKYCIKHRILCQGRLLYDRIDFDVVCPPIDVSSLVFRAPHAVIISDYGKGNIGHDLVPHVRKLLPDTPILVDPARGADWRIYAGASAIKCNVHESVENKSDFSVAPVTIVTLGGDGMDLHMAGQRLRIPTKATVPIDPTGCGDSAIATIAVCIARGFDYKRACELACRAGSLQCQRIGVSPVYWKELEAGVPCGWAATDGKLPA